MQIRDLYILRIVITSTGNYAVYECSGDSPYNSGGGEYLGMLRTDYRAGRRRLPTRHDLELLIVPWHTSKNLIVWFEDVQFGREFGIAPELRQEVEAAEVAPELRAMLAAADRHTSCRLAVACQTWPLAQVLR